MGIQGSRRLGSVARSHPQITRSMTAVFVLENSNRTAAEADVDPQK